jgi:hypothetical protein
MGLPQLRHVTVIRHRNSIFELKCQKEANLSQNAGKIHGIDSPIPSKK